MEENTRKTGYYVDLGYWNRIIEITFTHQTDKSICGARAENAVFGVATLTGTHTPKSIPLNQFAATLEDAFAKLDLYFKNVQEGIDKRQHNLNVDLQRVYCARKAAGLPVMP